MIDVYDNITVVTAWLTLLDSWLPSINLPLDCQCWLWAFFFFAVVPDGFSSDEDGSDASDEILDLSASLSETESEDGTQHEPVAKNTDDNSEHNEDVITQSVAAPAAAEPGLEDAPMTEGLVMETQVNSETSGDGGDKRSDELQFEGREPGGASSQSVADEVPVGGSTVGLDETYQAPDTSDDLTKTQRQTESRQGVSYINSKLLWARK